MSSLRSRLSFALRWLVLLASLGAAAAQADVYTDVSALLRDGKRVEALNAAQAYIATQPRDPQMRFILGLIQSESGFGADALQTFTLLTQEYPELPEPYNNLAVLLAAQSQFDKAREALEAAIRANPQYATAHENLGDIYAKLAALSYAKSLQLDATHSGAVPKLALIRQLLAPASNAAKSP
jgi:tetratricopeptide (TPR) repeat protein